MHANRTPSPFAFAKGTERTFPRDGVTLTWDGEPHQSVTCRSLTKRPDGWPGVPLRPELANQVSAPTNSLGFVGLENPLPLDLDNSWVAASPSSDCSNAVQNQPLRVATHSMPVLESTEAD